MSEVKVNKISPRSGTTVTLGDSGDTITLASGVSLTGVNATFSGDLTVDTNTLYVDSTNNRVGIGTSSPSTPLTLDIGTNNVGLFQNSTDATSGFSLADNGGSINLATTSSGAFRVLVGGDANTSADNSSEAMRIASNGRVGIGTSSPERLLHLQSAAPEIMMKDSDDNSYNTILSNGGVLSFSTGNTEAMRIDSSGNVGIGATTIPEILTVNKSSNGGITGLSINNNYPTTSTASAGTGSGIRFGVNDGSFTSAFGDGRGSEILSVTTSTNGRSRDIVFKTDSGGTLGEVMRIDSSGNVLVSTTDTTPSENNDVSGISLRSNGQVNVSVDGGAGLDINRKTSDGQILRLRKDGTDVGSIGTVGGDLMFGTGDTHLRMTDGVDSIIPVTNTGADRDNAMDLGYSTVRFRNAYLGGSVYLGGTGSANALDDYEEGTWTPTLSNMNVSGTLTTSGRYVKVGKMVLAYGTFSATTSIAYDGSGLVGSFPFQGAVTDNGTATYVSLSGNTASGGIGLGDFVSSRFFFKNDFTSTGANQKTTFHAVYEANA